MEARAAPALPFSITTATATSGSSKGAKQTNTPFAITSPVWAEPVFAPAVTIQLANCWPTLPVVARSPMPFFTAARLSGWISCWDRTSGWAV